MVHDKESTLQSKGRSSYSKGSGNNGRLSFQNKSLKDRVRKAAKRPDRKDCGRDQHKGRRQREGDDRFVVMSAAHGSPKILALLPGMEISLYFSALGARCGL